MKIRIGVKICLVAIIAIFTGCASSYRSIHPQIVNYSGETTIDSVKFSYKYDVLSDAGNRKYARKERRNGIKIVALRLVNNTTRTLDFKQDIKLFANDNVMTMVPQDTLYDELKQPVAAYILYLLLTPIHKGTVNLNGPSDIFPFGYILGPGLAGLNMLIAAKANKNFKYDLEKYNLRDQKIPAGETVYGLIGIGTDDFLPLTIKVRR